MLLELANHLEVETPLGKGRAILLESKDNDYYWTVILEESCALVTFPQNRLKIRRNYSLGIGQFTVDEMKDILGGTATD
jgi:hypothetical protein